MVGFSRSGDGDDFAVLIFIDEKLALEAVLLRLILDPAPERPCQDVGGGIPIRAVDFVLGRF
jgi:hypothetical protein